MFNTDMSEKKSMFGSLLNSNKNYFHTVKLEIPYLDIPFGLVPEEMSSEFLMASLNILLSRFAFPVHELKNKKEYFENLFTGEKNDNIEELLTTVTDSYEEDILDELLSVGIDFELKYNNLIPSEDVIELKSQEYINIIESILEHLNKYFINYPSENNQEQLEYLISNFENTLRINIRYYNYEAETGLLYLFIPI